jgi:hypothetical protein
MSRQQLEINNVPASKFIKEAFDLNDDLSGPGRFDMHDPIQTELRHIKGWITMAENDALESRKEI